VLPQIPPAPTDIPKPPDYVQGYSLSVWEDFWTQPVSGLVDMRRDGERLRHWIWCVHTRETLRRGLMDEPMAMGSQGQMVAHPFWMVLARLNKDIERAEAAFGMTPLAKMRLTGALDQAEAAEDSIKARREGRRPTALPEGDA
jgi:P27 family predicted phage terminase small subunit